MRLVDLFRLALGNLRENPLRTGLCALSVAVGTGALLLIASIGLFGKAQVDVTLQTLGVSGLTVYLDNHGSGNPLSAELADQMGQAVEEIEQVIDVYKRQAICCMKSTCMQSRTGRSGNRWRR